VGREEPGYR
jgi:hypothetical protein